jgi:hypothetical protein
VVVGIVFLFRMLFFLGGKSRYSCAGGLVYMDGYGGRALDSGVLYLPLSLSLLRKHLFILNRKDITFNFSCLYSSPRQKQRCNYLILSL